MNIQDMHARFRVLAQQLGNEQVRGLLPESIDIYINSVISDIVHNELIKSIHTPFQENVNTQSSTMNPINLFRTLYRTITLNVGLDIDKGTDASILAKYDKNIGYYKIYIPKVDPPYNGMTGDGFDGNVVPFRINPMMYLGFSVSYKKNKDTDTEKVYGCRMIGADVIETTLRDFCNGASWSAPVIVLLSEYLQTEPGQSIPDDSTNSTLPQEYIELYTNVNNTNSDKVLNKLTIKYIKQPNIVKYDVNINNCVNCDLPEYIHYNLIEDAVLKFYQSIGITINRGNNQQNRQQQ